MCLGVYMSLGEISRWSMSRAGCSRARREAVSIVY